MIELKGLGLVTVADSATPEPLSPSPVITSNASIQAPATNTGNVRIGAADVESNYAGELRPGESMEIVGPNVRGIELDFDLANIYVDVDNPGDGVIVGYWARRD